MQTSQNLPTTDPRIPVIIEKKLQGLTYGQIAKDLGVARRTIYDIRQKEDFDQYINHILPLYDQTIKELLNSDQENIRLGAAKSYESMIRSAIPKQIHQRTEKAEIKIVLHEYTQPPET